MNIKLLTLAVILGTSAALVPAQEKADPKAVADAKKAEAVQKAELARKAAENAAIIKDFFAAADAAAKDKKYDLMLENYRKAIELSPENERFGTIFRVANQLERIDKTDMKKLSLEYFEKALQAARNSDERTNVLIRLAATERQFNEKGSLERLKSILDMKDATSKNKVAATLAMADYEGSTDAFEKKCGSAFEIAGSDPALRMLIHSKMIEKHTYAYGTKDYIRAEAITKDALADKSLQPAQRAGLLFKLSSIYELLDDEKSACSALDDVLKLENVQDNQLQEAYLKLAALALKKEKYMESPSAEDYRKATVYYEKILTLKKVNQNPANLGLAKSYFETGDYPKALDAAHRIIDNPSKNSNEIAAAYAVIGDVCFAKEEYANALEAYRQSSSLKKDLAVLEKQAQAAFAVKNYELALETLNLIKATDGRYANRKALDRWIENVKKQAHKSP